MRQVLTGEPAAALSGPGILVAAELTPAQAAELDRDAVQGFVLAYGSPTSHAAILARSRGIPAVVAAGAEVLEIAEGTTVIIDGSTGELIVDPSPEVQQELDARAEPARGRRGGVPRGGPAAGGHRRRGGGEGERQPRSGGRRGRGGGRRGGRGRAGPDRVLVPRPHGAAHDRRAGRALPADHDRLRPAAGHPAHAGRRRGQAAGLPPHAPRGQPLPRIAWPAADPGTPGADAQPASGSLRRRPRDPPQPDVPDGQRRLRAAGGARAARPGRRHRRASRKDCGSAS